MPEAVTTQGETLWIGTNRSAMRRVPYLVSSPEIAGPVSPIDATNLASDARVYIPGLKDYSGDLVWEANSQRYLPGELRDLLAMDGCHVWAERRMPLVGTRVSLEGTASVTMSAASPDSVQRVTVRITPSSSMSVEEWSPAMNNGYIVRIRTDASTHMDVVHVAVGYGGRDLTQVIGRTTRQQGAANIPDEWRFNGGVGPFGCFYAAFNVDDYVAGTESEEPVCTEAGRLAYKLDPYNLKRTLAGTTLAGTYNVMLVVPTVYWRVTGDDLYMSSSPSFGGVSGMVAYAHTATLPDSSTKVYPYIAIGVYEASSEGGVLLSASGKTPMTNLSHDQFKALADALTPAEGSDFQQWNFWQWTLYKMMCYTVMGTKNAQWMLGNGPSANLSTSTGLSDALGPYADSGTSYVKMLIENPWRMWQFIGDVMSSGYSLHAGNTLGGAALGGQPGDPVATLPATEAHRWIASTSNASASWDLPATATATSNADDPAASGDKVMIPSGDRCIIVGGGWTAELCNINGLSLIQGDPLDRRYPYLVSRLSAYLDDYAVGLTDEAPANRSAGLLMSSPSKGNDREELARMVEEAQRAAAKEIEAEAKETEIEEDKAVETKEAKK